MFAEPRKILRLWRTALAANEEIALATVVRVNGSSYRKPGARMLVTRSGMRAGTVSGGCLEAEVSKKIWWLTESGPSLQRYATTFDEDGTVLYGLGCGGTVDILMERGPNAKGVLDAMIAACEPRRPSAILTVIESDCAEVPVGSRQILSADGEIHFADHAPSELGSRLAAIGQQVLSDRVSSTSTLEWEGSRFDLFAEYLSPPPALYIFGAGDDAQPLNSFANSLGWHITVADGRAHLTTRDRFPLADRLVTLDLADPLSSLPIASADAAVILTHSYRQDGILLDALLPLDLAYLGILGPRRRTAQLIRESASGAHANIARLHTPVGLDIGAGAPESIALSIIAEIHAVLNGREARRLRSPESLLAAVQHG